MSSEELQDDLKPMGGCELDNRTQTMADQADEPHRKHHPHRRASRLKEMAKQTKWLTGNKN